MDKDKQQDILAKIAPNAPLMKDRLTKGNKDSIRAYFRDEWVTLQILRDLFFGFKLTKAEKDRVKEFSPELKATLRKIFLPELTKENPIGNQTDLWRAVNIADKTPEAQKQALESRQIFVDLQETALALLDNLDGDKIDLNVNKDTSVEFIMARKLYVDHIEQVLIILNTLAYQEDETLEEMQNRLKRDSAR